MRQLYYPTSQQQYFEIVAEGNLLEESHNLFENGASAIKKILQGFFFLLLLSISGVGIALLSWLAVLDEGDL